MNLSTKLISGFLATSLITLLVGVTGISNIGTLNATIEDLYDNNLLPIKDVANANMQAIYHNRDLYDYVIEGQKSGMDQIARRMNDHEAQMKALLETYRKTELTEPEKNLLRQIDEQWPFYIAAAKKVMAFSYEGKNQEALATMRAEAAKSFQVVDDQLSKIVDLNEELAKRSNDASRASYLSIRRILLLLIIASVIISAVLGLFLTRSITRPLDRIIKNINRSSDQVAVASSQMSSSSQSLAGGANQQAAAIEETSSALEEMSTMTKLNAANAGQAHALTLETNSVVEKSNAAMHALVSSMSQISEASVDTAKILKTIDEIAFQTKLLALNAAVEAAQAGEAGAGFAVVADEVRNLAMRAASAAKTTAELIDGTAKTVADGAGIVAQANESLMAVAASAAKVAALVGEIANASGEQAKGIDHINIAISELDKVVQNNAANAEESAAAASSMTRQAEHMKFVVNELVDLINGDGASNQPHAHLTQSPRASKSLAERAAVLSRPNRRS